MDVSLTQGALHSGAGELRIQATLSPLRCESIGGCCQSTVNFTVNAKLLSDKELCVILAPTVKILKIDSWWLFIVNCSANE